MNYFQNQGIHSILRIHKSDPTETRKSRNWRTFGARMRSELDSITSVCCGGECDLTGCQRRSSQNDINKHRDATFLAQVYVGRLE